MIRVWITGWGSVSPFGETVDNLFYGLGGKESGIVKCPELAELGGLRARIAGLVPTVDEKLIPRKFRRSMSKMGVYAVIASTEALAMAKVSDEFKASGQLGVMIGSTLGSPETSQKIFGQFLEEKSLERIKSTLFFHIMSHSAAANVAYALGIKGRVGAVSAACATGCQAAGFAYESVAAGKQQAVLAGGSDEFHPLVPATFDIINAASPSKKPQDAPRPFDVRRDGVVCAEGCGVVLVEAAESAVARGARPLAEIEGFATVADGTGMANPSVDAIEECMRRALADAGLDPSDIGYVNAHATGTAQGDAAEAEAIGRVFGDRTPVSGFKGHMGHTMAASGALELIATGEMLRRGELWPTRNLEEVDPNCAGIRHVSNGGEKCRVRYALKNSFAMGGINTSMILGSIEDD